MKKEIIFDGNLIYDKKSLFEEINRALMSSEDWEIGESLDAISDILYGGVGEIKGNEPIRLIWNNFNENEKIFGTEFTISWYKEKLSHPELFDVSSLQRQIVELGRGAGQTYMDMIVEIIAEHKNIEFLKS